MDTPTSRPSRALQIERSLSVASKLMGEVQESFFVRLARVIARRPVLTVVASMAIFLGCLPGMLILDGSENMFGFIKIQTSFLDIFTFSTTDEYKDYRRATSIFPDTRNVAFIAKLLSGPSLISSVVLQQIQSAEVQLSSMTTFESVDGRRLGFQDVCERFKEGSPCLQGSVAATLLGENVTGRLAELEALEVDGTAATAAAWAVAGMSLEQRANLALVVASPLPFPGPRASESSLSEWLLASTATMSSFTVMDTEDGVLFEKAAARDIDEKGYPKSPVVRINQFSSSTIAMESASEKAEDILQDGLPCCGC